MAASNTQQARIDLVINGQSAVNNLRDLEAAARQARAQLRGMMPGTAEFEAAARNLARINSQLTDVRVQAGLTTSSFDRLMQTVRGVFIGTLGANLAEFGISKITGYFTSAFESGKKLSDQIADIGRTTGMTNKEVEQLNSELSKIDTRTSTNDLREMAIVAGQFGVSKDQIVGFVEALDKVNIVMGGEFGGNAEAVATEMSKLRNIFTDIKSNDIGNDIGFISNAINKLAQDGVATAPVVSDLANRIGGYGIQVGLTTGQTLGLSATLQELNVSAERGGTAVVKILQKMLTNSTEFAKIAGMEVGSFKKLLNEDLFGAFQKVMEGSTKMGSSSTLLAGIIKDLEVQGAGASEVFAKLGSNTALLTEKVNLSNTALTNTNSITEQSKLKQENLAGSVEKLSKAWNSLSNNPAVVAFFKKVVDFFTEVINGAEIFANKLSYVYDLTTKGKMQADANLLIQQAKMQQEVEKTEYKSMEARVAGYKNGVKQMTNAAIEAELKKKEALYRGDVDYIKQLIANGKIKEANIELMTAKENALEIKVAKEILAARKDANKKTLEDKIKLTDAELKLEQKKIEDKKKQTLSDSKDLFDAELAAIIANQTTKSAIIIKEEKALKQLLHDLENNKFVLAENTRDNEINEVKKYYAERLALARQFGLDEKLVTDQESAALNVVNRKWDAKELGDKRKVKQAELTMARTLSSELQNLANVIGEQSMAAVAFNKTIALANIAFNIAEAISALTKNSEANPANAVTFGGAGALQFGIGIVRILANAGQAYDVLSGAPSFFDGGYTGKGGKLDSNGGFHAILHEEEYVLNKKNMQNPMVKQMVDAIENGRLNDTNNTSVVQTASTNNTYPKLEMLLDQLLNNGVKAEMVFDDERLNKFKNKQTRQTDIDKTLSF